MTPIRRLKNAYLHLGLHTAAPGTLARNTHDAIYSLVRGKSYRALRRGSSENAPIAFEIHGGVGDYLVVARYIRDFMVFAGNLTFDVYSGNPEVVQWIFGSFAQFGSARQPDP